jgi:hypothetical protein
MGKPFSAILRARFWPMTARPARPILVGLGGAAIVTLSKMITNEIFCEKLKTNLLKKQFNRLDS